MNCDKCNTEMNHKEIKIALDFRKTHKTQVDIYTCKNVNCKVAYVEIDGYNVVS